MSGDSAGVGGERIAGCEDVVVEVAAALCCDDVGVVGEGDLVDDADEATRPVRVGVARVRGW